MRRWGLAVFIVGVLVVVGVILWWPPEATPNRKSGLGVALIGTAVIAFAVLYLERLFTKESDKRVLQIQLSLTDDLSGIDLSGRDLSGFYLPGKNLKHADLRGANLRDANLSGVKLNHADLSKADLRGTKLDETGLFPSQTLVPSGDLVPGPIFPEANLQGVHLVGAKYDKYTTWPKSFDADNVGAKRGFSLFQEFPSDLRFPGPY